MPCNLSIIGVNFDVEGFNAKCRLKSPRISYKGQPRFKTKPEGEKLPYSAFSVATSKADFDNMQKQISDTIRYLKRNKAKLAHIATTKGIQYAILDFGIDLRVDRKKVLTQREFLPNSLLKLAGDLGLSIELSIYPPDLELILESRSVKRNKVT